MGQFERNVPTPGFFVCDTLRKHIHKTNFIEASAAYLIYAPELVTAAERSGVADIQQKRLKKSHQYDTLFTI